MTGEPWTLTFDAHAWRRLNEHLFPGDDDEHGAVVLAGIAQGRVGLRLLVRDVVLARDGVDYVPGRRGYRALDPMFIAAAARRARDEGWAYLAVHCHGGVGRVAFSSVDMDSHQRGYPSLTQITGLPVGGLVVARGAIDGDLWFNDGSRSQMSSASVLGRNIATITRDRLAGSERTPSMFDRQARMFGAAGQQRLRSMRVAVVGLGGAGSMAAEMLARLGVGELVLIDPDHVEPTNLPRIVGSSHRDAFPSKRWRLSRRRGEPSKKVHVAANAVRAAGLPVRVTAMPVDVVDPAAVAAIRTCDWIVLAADTQRARHLLNAIAHAYLIPMVQLGVKVPVDPATGSVGQVFTVARRVVPDAGCLWCNGLIDPTSLQLEALGEEGDRARAYVGPDAPAPSVISLNGIAVSMGITDLLLATVGLLDSDTGPELSATYARYVPRLGRLFLDEPRRDSECLHCGNTAVSLRARGDVAMLPVPLITDYRPPARWRRRGWLRSTWGSHDG
jgi:tRNA A37 threonylcarbamoyladenosine dehydratase